MAVLCRKTMVNIQMNEAQCFASKMLNTWLQMGTKNGTEEDKGSRLRQERE